MASKTEIQVRRSGSDMSYIAKPDIVYKEGCLFVYQDEQGWYAGHCISGLSACKNFRWAKKRDALAFVDRLLAYEENGKKIEWSILDNYSIDWNSKTEVHKIYEKWVERNGKVFLHRACETCLK